jgi:hypothetical protein
MSRKGKKQVKVTLLYGLPGCGKSHYAQERRKGWGFDKAVPVDVDETGLHTKNADDLPSKVADQVYSAAAHSPTFGQSNHVIIDGLFTTNEAAYRVLAAVKARCEAYYDVVLEIIWWSPDREACLHNDKGRRDTNSEITIKTMHFEPPKAEVFHDLGLPAKRIIRRKVTRKPIHKAWLGEIAGAISKEFPTTEDGDKLESSTWSLGGSSGGYNSEPTPVEPDAQPVSFTAMDELLEKIAPNITFLQYKRIERESVKIETSRHGDYYGGSVTYAKFVCDLKRLYELLAEMGYVPSS